MTDEQRVIDPYERRVIDLSFRYDEAQIEYYFYEFPNGTWGFVVNNSRVNHYESREECAEDMTQNMKNFVLRQLNLPEEGMGELLVAAESFMAAYRSNVIDIDIRIRLEDAIAKARGRAI